MNIYNLIQHTTGKEVQIEAESVRFYDDYYEFLQDNKICGMFKMTEFGFYFLKCKNNNAEIHQKNTLPKMPGDKVENFSL